MKVQQWTGTYKSEDGNWDKYEAECDTILDGLKRFRVLKIKKLDNDNILFIDGCDEYFNVELTPEQVRLFIAELENYIK